MAGVIEESYGEEAEDERARLAPKPEILVQNVKNGGGNCNQKPSHVVVSHTPPENRTRRLIILGGCFLRCDCWRLR